MKARKVANGAWPSTAEIATELTAAGYFRARPAYNVLIDGGLVGDDSSFDTTALAAADAAAIALGIPLYFPVPSVQYRVSGTIALQSGCIFDEGAVIHVTAGSIAFNGGIKAEITQILNLASGVKVTTNRARQWGGYAEWLGAVSNDELVDCAPAINMATFAFGKTQLMGAVYYTATKIEGQVRGFTLQGVGSHPFALESTKYGMVGIAFSYFATVSTTLPDSSSYSPAAMNATIICCQDDSIDICDFGNYGRDCTVKGFLATRNVAPLITSNCVGVRLWSHRIHIEDVTSTESMIAFSTLASYSGSQGSIMNLHDLWAYRYAAGSGAGTDYFKGFTFDGNTSTIGIPSMYADKLFVWAADFTAGVSTAFYFDGWVVDTYCGRLEGNQCSVGLHINGNAHSGTYDWKGRDFFIDKLVADSIKQSALIVENTDQNGVINITDIHAVGQSTQSASLVVINNNLSVLNITGLNASGYYNTRSGIDITNSINVHIRGGDLDEFTGEAIKLTNVDNSSFDTHIFNQYKTGKGVQLVSGCTRNKFNVTSSGATTAIGYKALGTTNQYNEFNCTGIDPAGISGGSANKLVENSLQITTVGITAQNNVASGVMA